MVFRHLIRAGGTLPARETFRSYPQRVGKAYGTAAKLFPDLACFWNTTFVNLRSRPPEGCAGANSKSMKAKEQETIIAYWLVPAKPERELFNELIRILAVQMRAPRFEPHVTIFSMPENRQSPKRILARIKAQPIALSVRGIGTSAEYLKTMFVRLQPNKSLQQLVAGLRRVTKFSGNAPDPHLSLLYKNLSGATRRSLSAAVSLPFSQIVFDSIKAVRCSSPIRSKGDVDAWRVVATKSLK